MKVTASAMKVTVKGMVIDMDEVAAIAKEAGGAIMKVYNETPQEDWGKIANYKADGSPLTVADQAANKVICDGLMKWKIPIMSEENDEDPYEVRKEWTAFWCVDPLDGTKEFMKRNGQFTVNIGLVDDRKPIAGVVHVPATDVTYKGARGIAIRESQGIETIITVAAFRESEKHLHIVASASHQTPATQAFIEQFHEPRLANKGSSLKLLMIAEGAAHVYPRMAPCMEWDTCAAHAIVDCAGGEVLQFPGYEPLAHVVQPGKPLVYNKQDTHSPFFVVYGRRLSSSDDHKPNLSYFLVFVGGLLLSVLAAVLLANTSSSLFMSSKV